MKKYILVLLVGTLFSLCSCTKSPKFHYNDCVYIVDDFYDFGVGRIEEKKDDGSYGASIYFNNTKHRYIVSKKFSPVSDDLCQISKQLRDNDATIESIKGSLK